VALFSQHEGMPNALLEAMAAGKAIVATDVGTIPELLDQGQAGILVQEACEGNMVEAMSRLVQEDNLRFNLGRRATARVDEHYNLDRIFLRLVEYYKKVLA
jgi:glycosyltransferase involved in cell wall biosynthesis